MAELKPKALLFDILIVDKDAASRQLLKKVLSAAHSYYHISEAGSAEETLTIISKKLPDIIILDVMMPGNEGFDLCLLLKADERYRNIPVLIITALDKLEDKIRGFKVGASDYILKPINDLETNARVEAHLRIKRFQDRQVELNIELRKTQSALLQSSKLSAVGTLSAGVAHEFNNILQIIGGFAELCANCDNPRDLENMVNAIQECTRRGAKIVKGLLDFSKDDELQKKESVSLKELLEQNLVLMKKSFKDHSIEVETDFQEVPPFECYSGLLSQVFVNIMQNAIEAMARARTRKFEISMRMCGCETPYCDADSLRKHEKKRGCAVIVFKDSGYGVPDNIKEKIFEPFFTTKGIVGGGNDATPGTGLGLSISYGIIKRHNGFIECKSKAGEGASFFLTLPLSP